MGFLKSFKGTDARSGGGEVVAWKRADEKLKYLLCLSG
jgi:hypothetical protein